LAAFAPPQEIIPWAALEYVIGQINYGGRVTDDNDRRCLTAVLRQFLTPGVLEEGHTYTPSGTYYAPHEGGLEDYRAYVRTLPSSEAPEVFGMHANANVSLHLQVRRSSCQALYKASLCQAQNDIATVKQTVLTNNAHS
jgi:dynein heavy chain